MTVETVGLLRRVGSEFLGSALLAAVVVGSGAMAQALTEDVALMLTINAIATVFGLYILILILGPIGGAHFNPVVTLVAVAIDNRPARDLLSYLPAQIIGCIGGAVLANLMFEQPAIAWSGHDRATPAHLLAEVVATAGLILVIFLLVRGDRTRNVPAAVAAFIGAAYFFTSSTSFANPAITIGRMFTDTFAGIAPGAAPLFIGAQIVGASLGALLAVALSPRRQRQQRALTLQ
ncbi:MAG: aquaporin family protein [Leifsonia xyli]|jgi:glycerol uptake facilitator-like aquaporin|nr:MAG: aquaporin family protein [Leifsonia xyli]